jgi:adenine-specific DNA-methyltransferase
MSTPDLTDKNIEQIAALFPNVITEVEVVEDLATKGTKTHEKRYKKVVDFDLLRQMLSKDLVEGSDERYRLDWPGKKASLLKANTPITKTLRPCREESVNFDTTENLYIEGDNFEVLKILQESYLGKIKMIYIDPPYNTGNDFIYKDNFAKSKDEYEEELGTTDEEGGKLFRNTDSNGRYHSDWLSMMYERLVVARDLLKDDGVIFISIDDNEVHNLRKICDEVFGEENFVANIIWQKKFSRANDATYFSTMHDHIICFAKRTKLSNDGNTWSLKLLPRGDETPEGYSNPDNDPRGDWTSVVLSAKSGTEKLVYEITTPSGRKCLPPDGRFWGVNKDKFNELVSDNRIWFGKAGSGTPRLKTFLSEVQDGLRPNTVWFHQEVGHNQEGRQELKSLFDDKGFFDGPKPVRLLKRILQIANTQPNDIVLDFFSGSATTAHAVMQLNAEELAEELATKNTNTHEKGEETDSENFRDLSCLSWQKKGKRKFIMVQLPEPCDENSEAFKAGYKTIAEIGKERIRRAGKKIQEEMKPPSPLKGEPLSLFKSPLGDLGAKLDIGFRVYKTDSTNMKDVFYHPSELKQDQLSFLESNIKEDRTPEDLLTQVILDLGLELTLPIETKKILGNTVFIVQTNALVACFDNDIDFNIVDTISDLKPLKVVFKDASFKDDKDRINVEERFKRLSPDTRVTVI